MGTITLTDIRIADQELDTLLLLKSLREKSLSAKAEVCIERARHITTFLRDMSDSEETMVIRYARAVNHFLSNKPFALAGIIVMCDKYFGLSTGWMRFIETKLKLEEALKAFYLDWAELSARKAGEAEMITKMKGFVLQVESLVSHESALWIREFKTSLSSIDDMVKKNK
jgi:hypothetical protein